jgi:beta-lactamase class A
VVYPARIVTRSPLSVAIATALVGALAGAVAPWAAARDADLVRAHRSLYPAAEVGAARASGSEGVQAAYDVARDLQEAARRSAPVSGACRPLLVALGRYAAGRVRQMEGVDRPSAGDRAAGRRAAESARRRVSSAAPACRGRGGTPAPAPAAMSPADGEAFYGTVVARAPRGADTADLVVDGQPAGTVQVRAGRARFLLDGSGPRDLRVVFARAGRAIGTSAARGAILLPPTAVRATPGSRTSAALTASVTRAISGGPRYRAAWAQNLVTGEMAGVNAGAAFPAASTVKLGLLAGSLARLGASPERSPYAYDLRAMTTWSSNLATNRLLRRLGGTATAADGLRRLGARASTFTGEYIVGTELQPALPSPGGGAAPPRTSRRVTTARDLARMLYGIHAAAIGAPGARAETGLTAHQARLALGWLLASQQRGDNASLLAGGAPPGSLIAQKNGWTRSARHAAGIVYAPGGPAIVVLLTYDEAGVSLASARSLGERLVLQLAA